MSGQGEGGLLGTETGQNLLLTGSSRLESEQTQPLPGAGAQGWRCRGEGGVGGALSPREGAPRGLEGHSPSAGRMREVGKFPRGVAGRPQGLDSAT